MYNFLLIIILIKIYIYISLIYIIKIGSMFYQNGIIRKKNALVKVLGTGEITKALNITAHAFSASAKTKIEAAGGKAVLIEA